ncbi:MAG: methyl-accepting chemotaxis protein [Myxococcota bacterium]
MMKKERIQNSAVGQRLESAIFATSGVAVGLACLVFVIFQVVSFRADTLRSIETLAGALSINAADSLRFSDPETGEATLQSASAAPEAHLVAIYRPNGELFASYSASDSEHGKVIVPVNLGDFETSGSIGDGHLAMRYPIDVDGKSWGTMTVLWSTDQFWSQLWKTLLIVSLLILLTHFVSREVAKRLRETVARPLTLLAEEAQDIAVKDVAEVMQEEQAGEFETLTRALRAMTAMKAITRTVELSTKEVAAESQKLHEASSSMKADSIEQTTATAECLDSIHDISDSASNVRDGVDRAANRFSEAQQSITDLNASIMEVSSQMQHVVESIDSTSSGSAQSAASVRQIVLAMEGVRDATTTVSELSSRLVRSVTQVETDAAATEELAKNSSAAARSGSASVSQTSEAIAVITDAFGSMSKTVGHLVERCEEITSGLTVIEEIADETKLLSFNAAILAAQAGEQGRGFSVVAQAIGELSARTAASADGIQDSLKSLHGSANAATSTVQSGAQKVARGVECARDAARDLTLILEATEAAEVRAAEISKSAKEQSHDIEQVEGGLSRVTQLADESTNATREQEKVGQEIAFAMEAMREFGLQVEKALGRQTQESALIAQVAESVGSELEAIRDATVLQAEKSTRIERGLGVVHEAAERTAERAEYTHASIETLAVQVETLRDGVEQHQS